MSGALPPTIVACTRIFLRLHDHRALTTNDNVVKQTNNKTSLNLNLSAQWDALFRVLLNVLQSLRSSSLSFAAGKSSLNKPILYSLERCLNNIRDLWQHTGDRLAVCFPINRTNFLLPTAFLSLISAHLLV